MHPVLESLRNTDRQWLIDTLYAFNSGDVDRFQTLKSAWGQQVGFMYPRVCSSSKASLSLFPTHTRSDTQEGLGIDWTLVGQACFPRNRAVEVLVAAVLLMKGTTCFSVLGKVHLRPPKGRVSV